MASKTKNQGGCGALTHSAVYRVSTSPSPIKRYSRPTSNHADVTNLTHFKSMEGDSKPVNSKYTALRNTVGGGEKCWETRSKNYLTANKNIVDEGQHSKVTNQILLTTQDVGEREKTQRIMNDKEGGSGHDFKRKQKVNFQNKEPLVNKIIKKLDDKQKLINQLKKLAETQLPTRTKKNSNTLKSIFANNKPKKDSHSTSYVNLTFAATPNTQQVSLKQMNFNMISQNGDSTSKRNLEELKEKCLKPAIYHTPKTTKTGSETNILKHAYSTVESLEAFSPTKQSRNDRLKKRETVAYENSFISTKENNNYTSQSFKKCRVSLPLGSNKNFPKTLALSDFKTIHNLGEGKFGTVSAAIHIESGFIFAIKKINKKMIQSHFMVQQLALQIRIQSYCYHKNIARLYAIFDDYQHLYLVLEYMQGGTLFSVLKKQRTFSQGETAQKVKHVAEAVKYLHDHGIAHRDIKPQNIVISNGVSKLCDFGWAAICNERRRTYCGTFDYAAPEILQGSEYDMSVDMWCLGVLAYELLVGKAPFYHISRKETMKKIMSVDSSSLQFPAQLSKNAVAFIKSLLKKQPEERMNAECVLKHQFLAQVKAQ